MRIDLLDEFPKHEPIKVDPNGWMHTMRAKHYDLYRGLFSVNPELAQLDKELFSHATYHRQ